MEIRKNIFNYESFLNEKKDEKATDKKANDTEEIVDEIEKTDKKKNDTKESDSDGIEDKK